MPNPKHSWTIAATLSLWAAASYAAPWDGQASPTGTLLLFLGVLAIPLGLRNWRALRRKPSVTKLPTAETRDSAKQGSDA